MWSHGLLSAIEVFSGMLEYWQELLAEKKSPKVINLEKLVKLKLIDCEGEQAIKLEE